MYTCDESQLLVTATVVTSSGLRGRRPQVTGSTTDADDDERLDHALAISQWAIHVRQPQPTSDFSGWLRSSSSSCRLFSAVLNSRGSPGRWTKRMPGAVGTPDSTSLWHKWSMWATHRRQSHRRRALWVSTIEPYDSVAGGYMSNVRICGSKTRRLTWRVGDHRTAV